VFAAGEPIIFSVSELLTWTGLDLDAPADAPTNRRWLPEHTAGLAALGNPYPRVAGVDASVSLNYFGADDLSTTTVRSPGLPATVSARRFGHSKGIGLTGCGRLTIRSFSEQAEGTGA
jgi:hypothetical protein